MPQVAQIVLNMARGQLAHYCLSGAAAAVCHFAGHVLSRLTVSSDCQQLTLQMQSPAVHAAAQQANAAAAAAAEAAVAHWQVHQVSVCAAA